MRLYKNLHPGLFVLIFISCYDNNKQKDVQALNAQLDSLKREVNTLKEASSEYSDDSGSTQHIEENFLSSSETKDLPKISPSQLPSIKEEEKLAKKSIAEDTTKYFYKNPKRISLSITPWHRDKRNLTFFDPFGKKTYTIEDVRSSYSDVTHIKKFHDNGAVAMIERSLNPGASMYWYEDKITFDINNNPLWKVSTRQPLMEIEDLPDNYWWNNNTQQWQMQEVVEEQQVPED